MSTLRTNLQAIASSPPGSCNAGLWLDRYLSRDAAVETAQAKQSHLERATGFDLPDGYPAFVDRIRDAWFALDARVFKLATLGRMIVGLGRTTPWENGIQLHHTWGVPMIPGSALKGLAAAYAHQHLEDLAWRRRATDADAPGGTSHDLLFGTRDGQGVVTFHDAVFIPNSSRDPSRRLGIHLDTVTVHHPNYYQHTGDGEPPPPADWDAPVPIPFLSAQGAFLCALSGPDRWVDAAQAILSRALTELGVGAKTSNGYGRMRMEEVPSPLRRKGVQIRERIDGFALPSSKGELNRLDQLLASLDEMCRDDQKLLGIAVEQLRHRLGQASGDMRTALLERAQRGESAAAIALRQAAPPEPEHPVATRDEAPLSQALSALAACAQAKDLGKRVVKYLKKLQESEQKELARAIQRWCIERGEAQAIDRLPDIKRLLG
jgi:CRISPR-associated protein Cmr6